jgi:1-aminocyclopropane-1-carboxylate deaminase/D-cysteine desulfhydrase-like pyridoxal-dependent ACC family enzyme
MIFLFLSVLFEKLFIKNHILLNHKIYIKRDDLTVCNMISGNKVRKAKFFKKLTDKYDFMASYGGYQSNSMLALSRITHNMTTTPKYLYFTKNLNQKYLDHPMGNLKQALENGMKVRNNTFYHHYYYHYN